MAKALDVATTVLEKSVFGKKLKIKILTKKPGNEVSDISEQVGEMHGSERLLLTDNRMPNTKVDRHAYSAMGKKPVNGGSSNFSNVNCLEKSSRIDNQVKNTCDSENHKTIIGTKRSSEGLSDCLEGKRLKMDCIAASRCQNVLLKLMKHKFAKPFLDPVNPAAWGIHDYFDVIKHPMDLGTVKQKLHRNTYISAEEFEADVRLTFSNAMLYNPSNNWVHQHAKRLCEIFDSDWKSVKAILFRDHKNIMKKRADNGTIKIADDVRSKCQGGNSSSVKPVHRNLVFRKENGCEDFKTVSFKVHDVLGVNDHVAKGSKQLRSNLDFAAPVFRCDKESACPMSTEETPENTNRVVPKELNSINVINTSMVQITRSDQDSEGAVSCLDEEHAGVSVPTAAGSFGSAAQSLDNVLDMELSPTKALRAAKLKSRFADTILKAQNKTLLQPCGKTDAGVLEKEKEILLRKQREERSRIEAQVRAAESAARLKTEDELRKQRQQAREAARATLEKMERSVNLDDNFHTLKDLEALVGSSLLVVCPDSRSRHVWNQVGRNAPRSPLERLGLYIKAEYRIGDDDDEVLHPEMDLEEGEVP